MKEVGAFTVATSSQTAVWVAQQLAVGIIELAQEVAAKLRRHVKHRLSFEPVPPNKARRLPWTSRFVLGDELRNEGRDLRLRGCMQ
jgi:hypothetical protein